MDRRTFLGSTGAAAIATALPTVNQAAAARTVAATAGANDAKLRTLLDRFFYDRIDDNPEGATALGLDNGARAALKG